MVHIRIKNGLDIPIVGTPLEKVDRLSPGKTVALSFHSFGAPGYRLKKKEGDKVLIGEPLAIDKSCEERVFVSPAAGIVKKIKRGAKRVLESIVIECDSDEGYVDFGSFNIEGANRQETLEFLLKTGMMAYIRQRPFNVMAQINTVPRDIFVKALESAPFVPDSAWQIKGYEEAFEAGIKLLSKMTEGSVHLFKHKKSEWSVPEVSKLEVHTAEGPHPSANSSMHIHSVAPIQSMEDVVWTVNAWDVIAIGYAALHGKSHIERVISIAGEGILEERRQLIKTRVGVAISDLLHNRNSETDIRLISGDPLMGREVEMEDHLHPDHFSFTVIPESKAREFLHFFRLGGSKYTASKAYLSGHLKDSERKYHFTTSQHGEERAFIDGEIYDRVMPMNIPTMGLVKAVICEDYELAEELGLLEVDAEDFALATFICPSKVEMVDIIEKGLKNLAAEVVY